MIVYERRDGRIVIRHTVVDPEFRGHRQRSRAVHARRPGGETLANHCGFVADYIDRNPGYARLVDTGAQRPGGSGS
jgi:predicted GNAT family acetyltransferase